MSNIAFLNKFKMFKSTPDFEEPKVVSASVASAKKWTPIHYFSNRRFCVTGKFSSGFTRSKIEDLLRSLGGVVDKKVSHQTHVLIAGGDGSANYKNGGGKFREAAIHQVPINNEIQFLRKINNHPDYLDFEPDIRKRIDSFLMARQP